MDGIEVCREIDRRWNDPIPIVFATGHGDADKLGELLARRHVAFLLKPFDLEDLLQTLVSVMPHR